ncbi:aldehyde dehydrogenase [Purpureocillium lavendulum]|uniref:Aldehyde dehydrogenase n=1 Tax=Purpureocillium lavendulum TaxID=1247861 RepID=A0AB34FUA8_9HYPO|nr:aldehyde dehydrogenase [Purpureocillium lavendulum]
MDPTTTLITFLLQTDPSVQSVQLIGSWDNFSACYTMRRDVRRGRGQWRGCYSFKDIVCDDVAPSTAPRNGGLKMGATYYYYYELDGSTEAHDPAESSTTACPFLPGQTVNTLIVPVEQSLRQRSASLNSMRGESFRTMDPDAKFATPRPSPVPAVETTVRRLGSASNLLQKRPCTRSPSPAPSWKRFFTRRLGHRDADRSPTRCQTAECSESAESASLRQASPADTRSSTPLEGVRTRDLSPESLRRFLSDATPTHVEPIANQPTMLSIPDEITEDIDDDDNFATSAVSENHVYPTSLSPPPFQRSVSADTIPRAATNLSSTTITAEHPCYEIESAASQAEPPAPDVSLSKLETNRKPRWSISAASSALATPISPQLAADDPPSFYDSNDEDDVVSTNEAEAFSHQPIIDVPFTNQGFRGYSLPRQSDEEKIMAEPGPAIKAFNSPHLLPGADTRNDQVGGANLLGTHIDTGLDDFVSEMGWIVDAIGCKENN